MSVPLAVGNGTTGIEPTINCAPMRGADCLCSEAGPPFIFGGLWKLHQGLVGLLSNLGLIVFWCIVDGLGLIDPDLCSGAFIILKKFTRARGFTDRMINTQEPQLKVWMRLTMIPKNLRRCQGSAAKAVQRRLSGDRKRKVCQKRDRRHCCEQCIEFLKWQRTLAKAR